MSDDGHSDSEFYYVLVSLNISGIAAKLHGFITNGLVPKIKVKVKVKLGFFKSRIRNKLLTSNVRSLRESLKPRPCCISLLVEGPFHFPFVLIR